MRAFQPSYWACARGRENTAAADTLLFIDLPGRYQTSLGNSRALNLTLFRAPPRPTRRNQILSQMLPGNSCCTSMVER
jgi:hypothetical protein